MLYFLNSARSTQDRDHTSPKWGATRGSGLRSDDNGTEVVAILEKTCRAFFIVLTGSKTYMDIVDSENVGGMGLMSSFLPRVTGLRRQSSCGLDGCGPWS